jgi:hypothetical protein
MSWRGPRESRLALAAALVLASGALGVAGAAAVGAGATLRTSVTHKKIKPGQHYSLTLSGDVPTAGQVSLWVTDLQPAGQACPSVSTESENGVAAIPTTSVGPGAFKLPLSHLGATPAVTYRYCAYLTYTSATGAAHSRVTRLIVKGEK